jgi:hypothetical protein
LNKHDKSHTIHISLKNLNVSGATFEWINSKTKYQTVALFFWEIPLLEFIFIIFSFHRDSKEWVFEFVH